MRPARFLLAACAAAPIAMSGLPCPAAPARDARLWAAAEAARTGQLALLRELVDIDSGTGDVEGGRRVAAVFQRSCCERHTIRATRSLQTFSPS